MSREIAHQQLAQTLKIAPADLQGLDTLSAEQLQTLDRLIQDAKVRQRQSMNEAIDRGLDHVPALLRGAVKKIVRG